MKFPSYPPSPPLINEDSVSTQFDRQYYRLCLTRVKTGAQLLDQPRARGLFYGQPSQLAMPNAVAPQFCFNGWWYDHLSI